MWDNMNETDNNTKYYEQYNQNKTKCLCTTAKQTKNQLQLVTSTCSDTESLLGVSFSTNRL